jgi:hypothetical protein
MSGNSATALADGPLHADPTSDSAAHGTTSTSITTGTTNVTANDNDNDVNDNANGEKEKDDAAAAPAAESKPNQGFRFWAIVAALAFTALLSSLEGTIITSALPRITADLGGGNSFIWVPNGYFLATIVMLPLMAQASNLFGRRWLTLISVATFTLGSGICGGAKNQAMLIGGRVV